jgi:hypothetical protein
VTAHRHYRVAVLASALAVFAAAGLMPVAHAASDRSPALCGTNDTAETGIQGDVPRADQLSGRAQQGYNCGLAVVGQDTLSGQAASDLAWSGHCAFVQLSGGGVSVVDVSDPTNPETTVTLATGGQAENVYAVTTADRALLVAARAPTGSASPGTVFGGTSPVPVDVYDVKTDCAHPVKLGTVEFPGNVHNIEMDPSGTHVYASMPLQQADITDLTAPSTWTVRNFQCDIGAQVEPPLYPRAGAVDLSQAPCDAWPKGVVAGPSQISHEFEFNGSGTRMYIGDQNPYPFEQALHLVDMTVWPPKVVSTLSHIDGSTGGHAIRRLKIGGHPYLLNSNETAVIGVAASTPTGILQKRGVPGVANIANPGGIGANGCVPEHANPYLGTAQAWLTDIGDERAPKTVSQLTLAINDPANCGAQAQSGVNSTVHYEGVDNPNHTRFVMLPMKNAGLRVFDVSDPHAPTEVAYFNAGQYRSSDGTTVLDRARMHTYYDASTGHIWLTTETGGFWVLELEPQVRHELSLPALPALYPTGRAAKPGALASTIVPVAAANSARNPYFC